MTRRLSTENTAASGSKPSRSPSEGEASTLNQMSADVAAPSRRERPRREPRKSPSLRPSVVSESIEEINSTTPSLDEPIRLPPTKRSSSTLLPTAHEGAGRMDLEPATNLLPGVRLPADEADWTFGRWSGDSSPDPLAALARSVEDGEQNQPSTDSAALAADLVAEAVATYEEKAWRGAAI